MSVETYGTDEERFYYVDEATFGTTPTNPAMLSVPHDALDPGVAPGLIQRRGGGSYDLQALKKGLRSPSLKVGYVLPSAAPVSLLQWAKTDLDKSLSCQVLYWKGAFATPSDVLSLLFKGMRINKASLSCSIEDVIKATLELEGQDVTTGTAKIDGATYTDHSGAVAFNESYVKQDAATLDRVTDWKFDILNSVKRVPVIRSSNGHLARYVPFGHRELTGELSFEFEAKTEIDTLLADTEFTLEFGLGGTCKATFSYCKWADVTHSKWLEDLICCKAKFIARGPVAIASS